MDQEDVPEPYDGDIRDPHKYLVDAFFEGNGGTLGFIKEDFNQLYRRLPDICTSTEFNSSKDGMFRLIAGWTFENGKTDEVYKRPVISYGIDLKKYPLFPGYARVTNQSYSASLQMRVTSAMDDDDVKLTNSSKPFSIFDFPIMLQTDVCNLVQAMDEYYNIYQRFPELDGDPGGYFIIHGRERSIPFQQRLIFAKDIADTFEKKGKSSIYTVYKTESTSKKIEIVKYVKGKDEKEHLVLNYSSVKPAEGNIPRGINLYLAFAVLGYSIRDKSLKRLFESVIPDEMDPDFAMTVLTRLQWTILEGERVMSRVQKGNMHALEAYLVDNDQEANILTRDTDRAVDTAKKNFQQDVFPHIAPNDHARKAQMLAYMTIRLFQHIIYPDRYPADDKNDDSNIQFQSPAIVFEKLVQQIWSRAKKAIQEQINKIEAVKKITPDIVADIIASKKAENDRIIDNSFNGSIWGMPKSQAKNVVQELNRDAFNASIIGQLTRVVIESRIRGPQGKEGGQKTMESRMIRGAQIGTICIMQTPDNSEIGLTGNLTYISKITGEIDVARFEESLNEVLDEGDIVSRRTSSHRNVIFLNGIILGWGDTGYLFEKIRNLRRRGKLYAEVDEDGDPIPYFELGLQIGNNNLYLRVSSGRAIGARIIIYTRTEQVGDVQFVYQYIRNFAGLTWNEMLAKGVVEYIDPAELGEDTICPSYKQMLVVNDEMENLQEQYVNTTNEAEKLKIAKQVNDLIREQVKTHVSLTPDEIYGHTGATIPYANRIMGPRIPLQCKMVEQTMTNHPASIRRFYVPKIRTLNRGDAPLIYTNHATRLGFDEYHVGSMVRIAFMPFEENQEDSVVWNRDSLRKFFKSKVYVDYTDQEASSIDLKKTLYKPVSVREKYEGEAEYYSDLRRRLFLVLRDKSEDVDLIDDINRRTAEDAEKYKVSIPPSPMEALAFFEKLHREEEKKYDAEYYKDNYDHLDIDGLPHIGSELKEGQILIGFIKTRKETDEIFAIREKIYTLQATIGYYKDAIDYLSRLERPDLYKDTKPKTAKGKIEIPRFEAPKLTPAEEKAKLAGIKKEIDKRRTTMHIAKTDDLTDANIILDKYKDEYRNQLAKIRAIKEDISGSVRVKFSQDGKVDQAILFSDDNLRKVRVRIVQDRDALLGNKEDNRTSQKATIGAIMRKEDLPFMANGQVCDAYVNPLGMPGRMTLAWLLEILVGKVDALSGTRTNADDFKDFDFERLVTRLMENGFAPDGMEEFYNPFTGVKMLSPVFTGPSFRSALKHVVDDKIGYRDGDSFASRDIVSGQAQKGRGRHGAYHVGPMELDAKWVSGVSRLVQSMMTDSRGSKWIVYCLNCGIPANFVLEPVSYNCPRCKQNNFGRSNLPTAFLTLTHYLRAAGIETRINFNKEDQLNLETYEDAEEEVEEDVSDFDEEEEVEFESYGDDEY